MNYFIIVLSLCALFSCSPRNPYYNSHLSDKPWNIFFGTNLESPAYSVTGENMIGKNTFKAVLEDSLIETIIPRECVIEVDRDDKENQVTAIRLVGISAFDKKANTPIGFDRYHGTYKRVRYELRDQEFTIKYGIVIPEDMVATYYL